MSNTENLVIENDPFIRLSKRVLVALENLLKKQEISVPVQLDTMLELAIGALTDAQSSGEVELTEVFFEHKEFTFDSLVFEAGGEYVLHDILAQVVCFRLIDMMKEFLNHVNVPYNEEPLEDEAN